MGVWRNDLSFGAGLANMLLQNNRTRPQPIEFIGIRCTLM